VRAGLVDPREQTLRSYEVKPLAGHLADFRDALLAKGNTRQHALATFRRAGRVLDLAGVRRVSELSPSKALGALPSLREAGMRQETINHHVRAAKAFSRWLWKVGRAWQHYCAHLTTSPDADRGHRRRALTPDEATRLIRPAERRLVVQGLSSPDRAVLYTLALGTGSERPSW
jgi:hypothetical protein